MKKILIGLVTLGSVSAFAGQDFQYPTYNGKAISSRSNKDVVCKKLTHNENSEALAYTKDVVVSSVEVVIIKSTNSRVQVQDWFNPGKKILSQITCSE